MIIVKPRKGQTGKDICQRLRRAAESRGASFTDLTLEMEVEKSKGAIENLDICGHLALELYGTFVATIMSVTDNLDDLEAGHRWLHNWLDSSGIGGTCEQAFNQTNDFGNVMLNHDTLEECLWTTRMVVAAKTDLEKMAKVVGEAVGETVKGAFEDAKTADKPKISADTQRILEKLGTIFGDYATPENGLEDVKNTCVALTALVPFNALGIYVTNAILAVNWGLVDYGLINAIRTEPLIGNKLDLRAIRGDDFQRMQEEGKFPKPGGPGGGFDDDTLDEFQKMFGGE